MSETQKVGRRNFIRYVGAFLVGAAIVGGATAAYYSGMPAAVKTVEKTVMQTVTTTVTGPPPTTPPPIKGPMELTVWYTRTFSPEEMTFVEKMTKEWADANKVKLSLTIMTADDVETKLGPAVEAGTNPDVIWLIRSFQGFMYAGRGLTLDLSDVFNQIGKDDVPDGFMKSVTVGGKPVCLPTHITFGYYHARKSALEKAGLKAPYWQGLQTWDQFVEVCNKINNPPDFYAVGFPYSEKAGTDGEMLIETIIGSFGGQVTKADGTVVLNSPETLKAVEFMRDVHVKYKFNPAGALTWDGGGNNEFFQKEQGCFVNNVSNSIAYWCKVNKPELYKDMVNIPPPMAKAGLKPKTFVSPWGFFIFKNAKNPDLAKKFLIDYLTPKSKYFEILKMTHPYYLPMFKSILTDPFYKTTDFEKSTVSYAIPVEGYPEPEVRWNGFEAPIGGGYGEFYYKHVLEKMMLRVITEGVAPDKAVADAHDEITKIYAKYK